MGTEEETGPAGVIRLTTRHIRVFRLWAFLVKTLACPICFGKISYSIYLVQLFAAIVFGISRKLPGVKYGEFGASAEFWVGLGYCIIFLILTIGLSSLTYYAIEKPCRRYINRRWGKELMPVYA